MFCPDENALVRFSQGRLTPPESSSIEAHVDSCDDCRRVVAAVALASTSPVSRMASEMFRAGDLLGRYRIEQVLGSGAMGIVYAAFDPQLGRRVALKLMHGARPDGLSDDDLSARILREAQSMARLAHPNVVSVFEIGNDAGRLFVAMELSEGVTLDRWLRESIRSRGDILRAFIEAGRGLAAAHRAGIVHRDFKPQNVLVDRNGRVRVTDFGLAAAAAVPAPGSWPETHDAAIPAQLTRTSAVVGTPGYMAPEQFGGQAVAASDQFSFCVALFEALAGHRPFEGDTLVNLRQAVLQASLPRSRRLPRGVWLILQRGLARSPQDRFRDMDALLAALIRVQRAPRRWIPVGVAAGLVAAWGGAGLTIWPGDRSSSDLTEIRKVEVLELRMGELHELTLEGVKRLAIGDSGVADLSVGGGGRVLITPISAGATTLIAWTDDGKRYSWNLNVAPPSR